MKLEDVKVSGDDLVFTLNVEDEEKARLAVGLIELKKATSGEWSYKTLAKGSVEITFKPTVKTVPLKSVKDAFTQLVSK